MRLNPWFISSILLLGIWLLFWIFNSRLRKRMLLYSVLLMPTGIAQAMFVPEYWDPSSVFNLTTRIGFDIESLVFSFAIGGISIALFELFPFKRFNQLERTPEDQRLIISASGVSVIIYIVAELLNFNPIYSLLAALYSGSFFLMTLKPTMIREVIKSGLVFLCFYTIGFMMLNLLFPDFISKTWNFSNLSNILILGIPAEEFAYAFGFAMMWYMLYRMGFQTYVKR